MAMHRKVEYPRPRVDRIFDVADGVENIQADGKFVGSSHAIDASRVFERIAKEGWKYGMFLTVASQRPSELSRTVLSQCSNFLVRRIQNPDDLSHIRQMTPFISESVMKRLPSLPKQHALMFKTCFHIRRLPC